MRARVATLALACAAACQKGQALTMPDPALSRMMVQPRVDPYAPSTLFADGRAMRAPPEGTVPRGRELGDELRIRGAAQGVLAAHVPVPVTRATLELGRARFEALCAACHGVLGDGQSSVARNMRLRPPPSLHEPRIRAFPPGRIYQTIAQGYGMMPSYGYPLSVDERWAVVAYVRALQLSQRVEVTSLPEPLRAELARELP